MPGLNRCLLGGAIGSPAVVASDALSATSLTRNERPVKLTSAFASYALSRRLCRRLSPCDLPLRYLLCPSSPRWSPDHLLDHRGLDGLSLSAGLGLGRRRHVLGRPDQKERSCDATAAGRLFERETSSGRTRVQSREGHRCALEMREGELKWRRLEGRTNLIDLASTNWRKLARAMPAPICLAQLSLTHRGTLVAASNKGRSTMALSEDRAVELCQAALKGMPISSFFLRAPNLMYRFG